MSEYASKDLSSIPFVVNPEKVDAVVHTLPIVEGYDPKISMSDDDLIFVSLIRPESSISLIFLIFNCSLNAGISSLVTEFPILRKDMKQGDRSQGCSTVVRAALYLFEMILDATSTTCCL